MIIGSIICLLTMSQSGFLKYCVSQDMRIGLSDRLILYTLVVLKMTNLILVEYLTH